MTLAHVRPKHQLSTDLVTATSPSEIAHGRGFQEQIN